MYSCCKKTNKHETRFRQDVVMKVDEENPCTVISFLGRKLRFFLYILCESVKIKQTNSSTGAVWPSWGGSNPRPAAWHQEGLLVLYLEVKSHNSRSNKDTGKAAKTLLRVYTDMCEKEDLFHGIIWRLIFIVNPRKRWTFCVTGINYIKSSLVSGVQHQWGPRWCWRQGDQGILGVVNARRVYDASKGRDPLLISAMCYQM